MSEKLASQWYGIDHPKEWELEQAAFDAMNHPDTPEWVKETIEELWVQYCAAVANIPPKP